MTILFLLLIRFAGFFIFLTGLVLGYSFYRILHYSPFQFLTATQAIIPIVHVGAGLGLMTRSEFGRQLSVYLSVFYLLLEAFIASRIVEVTYFLPIAPMIGYLPISVLRWNFQPIAIACFVVLPLFLLLALNVKAIAFQFDPNLKGEVAWKAPFSVVFSGAFIFAFSLLTTSQIAFILKAEPRSIFGIGLSPYQAQISRCAEFYAPFVLSMWILIGRRLTWFFAFLMSAYFCWIPLALDPLGAGYLKDIKFVIFSVGWFIVVLSLSVYWQFFWNREDWLEETQQGKSRRLSKLLFIFLFLLFLVVATFPYLLSVNQAASIPKTVEEPEKAHGASSEIFPSLKFQGSSIDAQGTYAVIDGQLVKAGMEIEGYKIEKIERRGALISKDGKRFWIDNLGHVESVSGPAPEAI